MGVHLQVHPVQLHSQVDGELVGAGVGTQGPENRRQRFFISFAEAIFEAYFSLDKIRFFFVEQNVQRKKKPSCNKMIDFNI